MDRGKRLSRSNVIGKQGELAFGQWAFDHGLSANKAETDVGVDFFAQVMSPVVGSESMEGSGPILGAQVKTVDDQQNPRVKLDRIDATDLLRQTQATCLFGLRLSDKSVHFQFLTKEFIDRLLVFLANKNAQFSIPYASMSHDASVFRRQLRKYTNPFEQLQLRIHLIKGRVAKAIAGADLTIQSSDDHTVCQVYVPWASSAFTVEASAREAVRLRVLREGNIDPEEPGVALHPVLVDALKETQSSALLLAGGAAERVTVGIRLKDQHATEPFLRHSFGTEIAYVHRAGFRLTWNTKAEPTPEGYSHAMESEVFRPKKHVPLTGTPLVFFRLFRPGAVLSLRPNWDLLLSETGAHIEHIGEAVDPIPHLCLALGLPLSRVALADIADEEFARAVWLLETLLIKNVPLGQLTRGFVVGPAASLPLEQVPTSPITISVPLGLNWKDTGIVIWVEGDADAFLHEGLVCGIRLGKQRGWRIEKTKRIKKSIYPELWVTKGWPAIPIGADADSPETRTFDPSIIVPFEAVLSEASPPS